MAEDDGMQRRYDRGSVLFHQGDASDSVFQILSGTVAVTKEIDGESIVLGRIGAGEFLGEMGVLESLERSATATAEEPVEVEIFGTAEFLTRVSSDSALALNLLRRLSHRLRDMNDLLAAASGHHTDAPSKGGTRTTAEPPHDVTLTAATYALQFYIGTDPITVAGFPFSVGRYRESMEAPGPVEPDLLIDDPQPYRLSPVHFILEEEAGAVSVRDCNTEFGTIVNGRSLGRDFPTEIQTLDHGENEIIAGGERSPYRFLLTISS
jgi:CRP-like cAMP-binding protein